MPLDFSLIQNNIIGQFLIPFALFFAIAFGSLRTSKVFEDKQINAIIAAAIAFFATLSQSLVSALFEFMPAVFVILVVLFAYNLISTLLGGKKEGQTDQKKEGGGDVLLVVGAMLLVLAAAGKDIIPDLGAIDQTNLIFMLALVGIAIVVRHAWGKGTGASKGSQGPGD